MTKLNEKWVFIVNPHAGKGAAKTIVPQLNEQLRKYTIEAEIIYTEKPGHATLLAKNFAEKGFKYIIGVGGDGTLNEMTTSLINYPDVVTGIIPAGTGNDFIQILGFHDRLNDQEWQIFFNRNIIKMDVGFCNGNIFINGMGLGFDAQVAAENYVEPGIVKQGGKNKYVWHILKNLFFYKETLMTIRKQDEVIKRKCFINTIAIGRRFAGAFFLTPKAIANDGLLDVCAIENLNLIKRLDILMKVPKGTHINDRKINYFQVENFDLEFSQIMPYHLDGELKYASKFEVSIRKKVLSIIYNPQGNHYFNPEK